ncbi:ATP-dependent nuclease [Halococcus sp. AFM35]|uniref:ATP-dependent nuclease n=1 Tax=Halococcus sp. AFM35 TaxID=3421653 RepID=UPI003EC00C29
MSTLEISSVQVENFKSIRDSKSIETDDLNILIGKNDAGKSSMLEALRCFLAKSKPDANQFHKQDAEEIAITVTCSNVTDAFRDALGDEYTIDSDPVEIRREFGYRKGKTSSATTYLNGEELSAGAIVDGENRLSKAKSRDYIWNHFLPDPIWISAERDVREETKLKGGTVLNRLLEPILKEGGIEEDSSLQNKVDELEDSLTATAGTVSDDLTDRMQSHMPDIANIEINPGSVSLSKAISPTITIKDEYLDQSVDIAERGSGVGSLLVLSLMQAYVEMQVGEGYCLLFEEPGNFLHPAAERKMLNALKEISNEGQVCISTHSQAMIDQEKDASMHIVRRESGETSFELIEDDTFAIIDEIGARNSDLLQSDFVIYVEGPSDIGVLNEVARHAVPNWDSYNIGLC